MGLFERIYKDGGPLKRDEAGPTIAEAVADATAIATATAETPPKEVWGRPGRCPKCGGHGYLDRIDVVDRIQYEHCTECFHKWSVAEAQTVAPA